MSASRGSMLQTEISCCYYQNDSITLGIKFNNNEEFGDKNWTNLTTRFQPYVTRMGSILSQHYISTSIVLFEDLQMKVDNIIYTHIF